MDGHVLMERAGEQMNVPPDKIQAFLDDGWNVVNQVKGPWEKNVPAEAPVKENAPDVGKKPGRRSAASRK